MEQKWQPRKTGGLFPEKVSSFSSSVDSVRSKNLEEANDATRSNIPCKGGRKKKKEKKKGRKEGEGIKKKKKRKDEKDEQCSPWNAFRGVSPKATEPLILIIGYNLPLLVPGAYLLLRSQTCIHRIHVHSHLPFTFLPPFQFHSSR